MAYGVLIQNKVQASDVDALNRPAKCASAVENGMVFNLLTVSSTTGEEEVWVATAPATGALSNLWMAYEPEVNITDSKYKGLDPDPRNFIIPATKVFSAFRPQLGDIITLTGDVLTGSANDYAVATDADFQLNWGASAVSGLSLKLIETTYISIGLGSIGTQRVTAYKFEVVALA